MAEKAGVTKAHWIIALLVVGAAAGAAIFYLPSGASDQVATTHRPPPPVTVSKPASKEIIEWKEFTGQFEAEEYVEVRARVSG